jgi:hypothetical protein
LPTAARKKSCFELGRIGDVDEVTLTVDVPSNKTVDMNGVKSIMIETSGHEKTHYTLLHRAAPMAQDCLHC